MIEGVRWVIATSEWVADTTLKRQKNTSALQLVRNSAPSIPLVTYCTKHIRDNTYVSVFGKREDATDEPSHCANFPFPFMLPVYPKKDLVFVMYTEADVDTVVPFTLGERSSNVGPIKFLPLTLDTWKDMLTSMTSDAEDGAGVYGMLQAAFDAYWHNDDDEEHKDDFVADDDVATDLLLLRSTTNAAAQTSQQAAAVATAIDDDWNEEETVVDARTGFVVEKTGLDGAASEEDEDSEQGSSDEDEEEDMDLDDEEEEDEEDDIQDLELQNAVDDS